jgi:hydroxypyruvate isomerase
MKFSVCLDSLYANKPLEIALPEIRAAGITAVEFWAWENKDLKVIKQMCGDLDIQVAAFCTRCFELNNLSRHTAYFEGLCESIEIAHLLNCGMLITQVGQELSGVSRHSQHNAIIEGLIRCAPLLEREGMILVFEPLNTVVNHPGYYLTSSAEAGEIAKAVGSPRVKILFDFYHQQITEGNLIDNSFALFPYIGHVHCAGVPGRHEPDAGEVHYPAIWRALEQAGYAGYLGLEYFPEKAPSEYLNGLNALMKRIL